MGNTMISKNIFLEGQGRVRVSYIKGRCTYNNSIKLGSLTPPSPLVDILLTLVLPFGLLC